MNQVEVNESELAGEAAAILAGADATAAPAPGADVASGAPATAGQSWEGFIGALMPTVQTIIVPQWQLHQQEVDLLKTSVSQCLDQAFPGGPTGPYMCYVQLVVAVSGITLTRYLMLGHLPPFGPKRAVQKKDEPAGSGASQNES